jgi:hypothetical protein
MFMEGRLARISVEEPSRIVTPRGVTIGSTEEEVIGRYGARLEVSDAEYDEPPAKSMSFWLSDDRGVRFVTDREARVIQIHAGDGSITLVEGCS